MACHLFGAKPLSEPIMVYYTPAQRSCWGGILVSLHPSVCPSVCPSVRPVSRIRSVAPTVLVGSISYLYILLSNFLKGVSRVKFLAKFKNLYFWQFFKICNFDFVLLLLIRPLGTFHWKFEIWQFPLKKTDLKMSSANSGHFISHPCILSTIYYTT